MRHDIPKLHFFADFLEQYAAVAHRKSLPARLFLMKNNVFCVFFPGQMQLHHHHLHQLVALQHQQQ